MMADVVLIDDPQVKRQVTFSKLIATSLWPSGELKSQKTIDNINYY